MISNPSKPPSIGGGHDALSIKWRENMSNMSYCRFENTYHDVADCLSAVEEALEEGVSYTEFRKKLSSESERQAFDLMRSYCEDFIEKYDELKEEIDEETE
jgi:hypothetical protein